MWATLVKRKMLSDMLLEGHGIHVQRIKYPTVPRGTDRLPFTPSQVHDPRGMDGRACAMDEYWSQCALKRVQSTA